MVPSSLETLSLIGKLVGFLLLHKMIIFLSDVCLSQDLSVSDVEGEEEEREGEVGKEKEEEHNIITCSECREFSLTAF